MESNKFDFVFIFRIIRENIKVFLLVGICVGILAIIFSGPTFMAPKFKSVAVVYPVNINTYSDESETEQLLQMFESSQIRDRIVEKYDLYKRYEIEPNQPNSKYYLYLEYADRVITSKTQYESVLLEVFDEDPEIAKAMADDILVFLNEGIRSFRNERGLSKSQSFKTQMDYHLTLIDSLEKRIQLISEDKMVLNYEAQTRELIRAYVLELSRNKNSETTKELRAWLQDLESSGSLVQTLQKVSEYSAEQYGILVEKYLDWRAIGYEDVSYLDVVVEPEVADKKSWPVRWLILASSLAVAMILTLFALAIAKYSKS